MKKSTHFNDDNRTLPGFRKIIIRTADGKRKGLIRKPLESLDSMVDRQNDSLKDIQDNYDLDKNAT